MGVHDRIGRGLRFLRLEDRLLLNATPEADVTDLPDDQMVNEDFQFTVAFDNTSTDPNDVGYGPFVDVTVGPGIEVNDVTYLGSSVQSQEVGTWDGSQWVDGSGNPVTQHPLDKVGGQLQLPDGSGLDEGGDPLNVLAPFGSYTPDQPDINLVFSATMNQSTDGTTPTGAVPGEDIAVTAQGGFQFGLDPLDNPSTDPPVQQAAADTDAVTPIVMRIEKTAQLPEGETAQGPNFPFTYTISVDIANGVTITDLNIEDDLPENLFFLSTSAPGADAVVAPGAGLPTGVPGVDFTQTTATFTYASATGALGGGDIVITLGAYAPEFAADATDLDQMDADNPAAYTVTNGAEIVSANYLAPDGTPVAIDTDNSGSLQDTVDIIVRPYTVLKSVGVEGGGEATPGKYLEFNVDLDVSDYLSLQEGVLNDTLSDGLTLDTTNDGALDHAPVLRVEMNGQTYFFQLSATTGPLEEQELAASFQSDGTQDLTFFLSAAVRNAGAQDETLYGDLFLADGQQGPTKMTLTYYALIEETYRARPSPVVVNDTLGNTVNASLDSATSGAAAQGDGSASDVDIAPPDATKSVYAVNGVIGAPATIAPGDLVTYRLRIALDSLDVNDLTITDYLPSPVYDVDGNGTGFVVVAPDGGLPGAYELTLGPDDIDRLESGLAGVNVVLTTRLAGTPGLATDGAANALVITFPNFNQDDSQGGVIDLLYTIPAQDKPFADGLLLVNQAIVTSGDSQVVIADTEEMTGEVTLFQPELSLTKGAVATDANGAVDNSLAFSPDATNPTNVTFTLGDAGFTVDSGDPLTTDQLAATPISSDLSGIDAGDTVKFAIVVQNTGGQDAFDVVIRDMIPQFDFGNGLEDAFAIAGAGLLDVRYGDGTVASFSGDINDLFGAGIELTDGAGIGALSADGADDGRNIVIVTYELVALQPLQPATDNVNAASLDNYAAIEGGNNFTTGVDGDFTDQVTLTSQGVTVDKALVDTDQIFTTGDDFAIGEIGTFEITVTAPDGTTAATITDALPDGFALGAGTVILRLGSFAGTVSQNGVVLADGAILTVTPGAGNDFSVVFDEIIATGGGGTDLAGQSFIIEYRAQAQDDPALDSGTRAVNTVTLDTPTTDPVSDSVGVDIVEPDLTITKTFTPDTAQANDTVGMELVVSNASGAFTTTSFGLTLTDDDLPKDVFSSVMLDSLTGTGNVQAQIVAELVTVDIDDSDPTNWIVTVTADPTFAIAKGERLILDFSLKIDPDVDLGTIVDNTATVENYSSLSGEQLIERAFGPETGSDTLTISGPTVQKYLLNTSLGGEPIAFPLPPTLPVDRTGFDADPNVAVGEVLTYGLQIAFPRGDAGNVIVFDDTDFLNALGSQGIVNIVSIDQLLIGNSLTLDGPFSEADVQILDPDGDGIFNRLEFTIGQVNNDAGDIDPDAPVDAVAESIFIIFRAQVMNVPETDGGDVHLNGARVTYQVDSNDDDVIDGNDATLQFDDQVQITITEPAIDVAKSVSGAGPDLDAGDVLSYTLTISHDDALSNGDGYALNLTDALPENLVLDESSIVIEGFTAEGFDGQPEVSFNAGTNTLTISGFDLPQGQTVTITYLATVADAVVQGEALTNNVELTYQSLPDADPVDGYDPSRPVVTDFDGTQEPDVETTYIGESQTRDGSDGGPRTDQGLLNNYFFATDVTVTIADPGPIVKVVDKPTATIGETVTYTIDIPVIEGTTVNAVITDTLPPGVTFIPGTGVVVNGNGDPVDPALFTFTQSGQTLTITANDDFVYASDNDTTNDFVRISYSARVDNVIGNQNNDAETNNAVWTHDNGGSSDSATFKIVEPDLILTKTNDAPAKVDAGDTITFTITARHSSGSTADAFEFNFLDTIDVDLGDLTLVSATIDGQDVSSGVTIAGRQISAFNAADLDIPLGSTFSLVYTVVVQDSVSPDDTLTNTVLGLWSSLDGVNAMSGQEGGERIGQVNDDLNDYFTSATSTVNTDNVLGMNKTASVEQAAVGETVTYYLDIEVFEGTLQNVQVSDLTLPGMRIDLSTLRVVDNGTFNGVAPTITGATLNASPNVPGGSLLTFGLQNDVSGALINPGDPIGDTDDNDTIRIAYDAVVVNDFVNQDGYDIDNAAGVQADSTQVATGAETIEVVEPNLTIAKTVTSPSGSVDAGDVITYQVVLTNDGTSTAYDVTFTDNAPTGLLFTQVTSPSGTFTVTGGGAGLTGSGFDIAVGASVTITYSATVQNTAVNGVSFVNTATVDWTSTSGANPDERDGTDGPGPDATVLNNYEASDTATVTTDFTMTIDKALASSTVAQTAGDDLAVGETATYNLTLSLTEGQTRNVVIVDALPDGMEYVAGSFQLNSFPAGTTFDGGAFDASTMVSYNAATGQLTIDLGDVIVPGADDATAGGPDLASFVFSYDSVVENVVSNQSGVTLSNTVTVTADDGVSPDSATETIDIIEPNLTISKTVTSPSGSVDAGDVITYQIVLRNNGTSTAFDVTFDDDAPTGLVFTQVSATSGSFSLDAGGAGIAGTVGQIAVGGTVTITLTATVQNTINNASSFVNTATVDWTSTPGANANERDGTDGAGGALNDYEASNSAAVDADLSISVAKQLIGSDIAATTGDRLTIGETATYQLDITVSEGTINGLRVVDVTDGWMDIDLSSLTVVPSGFAGGTVNITDVSLTVNPTTGVATLSFMLDTTGTAGQIVNLGNNIATDDTITLTYEATVRNVIQNQQGDVIDNEARITADDGVSPDEATESIRIVEPNLVVDKTVLTQTRILDAGDTIQYQVVIRNNGASTAFDIAFQDAAPARSDFSGAPQVVLSNATGANITATADLVSGTISSIAVGGTVTITYSLVITDDYSRGDNFINDAGVTWTSAPGTDPDERTGAHGPDAPGGGVLNNYADDDFAIVVPVAPQAGDLILSKRLESSSVAETTLRDLAVGETATFRIRLGLPEGTTEILQIRDFLPAGQRLIDGTLRVVYGNPAATSQIDPVATATYVNNVLTLRFGNFVNPGDNVLSNDHLYVYYDAVIEDDPANVQDGDRLTNAVLAQDGRGATATASATVNIVEPDLVIEKDARIPLVAVGGTAFYQIRVSHSDASTADAFDLVVSDPFTTELLTVNDGSVVATVENGTGTTTVVYANGGFRLSLDRLELGATLVINFTAQSEIIAGADGSTAVNTSTLVYDSIPDAQTPDEQRDYRDTDDAAVVIFGPDLQLVKDASVAVVQPGDLFSYAIQVKNIGVAGIDLPFVETARDTVLTDTLPDDVTLLSVTVDGADTPFTFDPTTRVITISLGNLPPDQMRLVTLFMQAADTFSPATAGDTGDVELVNVAQVDMRQTDPTPENNIDDAVVTSRGVPDLVVEKTDDVERIGGGEVATFTITARNAGDRVAGDVVIVDRIDANVFEFVSASRGGVYDAAAGTVTWRLSTLSPDDGTQTFTMRLRVLPGLSADVDETTNFVRIDDNGRGGPDPTPQNNTDTHTDALIYPDLLITKSNTVTEVSAGDVITYQMTVDNVGEFRADGVVVRDVLDPAVFRFVSASNGGVYNPADNTVTWNLGTVASDDPLIRLTLTVEILFPSSIDAASVTNTAVVSSDGTRGQDSDLSNNTDSESDILNVLPDPSEVPGYTPMDMFPDEEEEDDPEFVAPFFTGRAAPGAMVGVTLLGMDGSPAGAGAAMVAADGTWMLSMSDVPADQAPVSAVVTTYPSTVTSLGTLESNSVFYNPGGGTPIAFERSFDMMREGDMESDRVLRAQQNAAEDPFALTSRRYINFGEVAGTAISGG